MEQIFVVFPILLFGVIVVYKFIYTQSFKLFFNLGKIQFFGVYELIDFVVLCVSAYFAINYSISSNFDNSVRAWFKLIVYLTLLYRFFYIGIMRLVFKQESIFTGVRIKKFFK